MLPGPDETIGPTGGWLRFLSISSEEDESIAPDGASFASARGSVWHIGLLDPIA